MSRGTTARTNKRSSIGGASGGGVGGGQEDDDSDFDEDDRDRDRDRNIGSSTGLGFSPTIQYVPSLLSPSLPPLFPTQCLAPYPASSYPALLLHLPRLRTEPKLTETGKETIGSQFQTNEKISEKPELNQNK